MASPHCSSNFLQRSAIGVLLGTAAIALITSCSQVKQQLKQITTPAANEATTALADHLTQTGAKMYGTYWCPYCNRQEELFGNAVSKLQVIECDPKGENAQPQLCAQANVNSFPTWEIGGKLYPGLQSLDELATLSGYKGARNFKD
ncbi:MAG: hypothetical protein NW224_30470 [Leptolyngbyaceae cyanobacterium bins.302]|nr:hypothetical protein [Leptolyngbyaceae cyanobacterium bins.302]